MTYNTINDAVTMPGGEGTLLANRYRIIKQLGQGGMGSVWLAEDTQLDGKLFAIKMLPSILVSNKRAYRQLKDEALVAMQLVHPNIVQIRAFEENSGNPFLVMDYIEGQTLDDYLAEKGKLSEDVTIKLLKPIAAALDYAHSEGVVHRDVKPANIMIRKDGHPYILDFGIAREMQETMTRVTGKLSSGTLLYMSPEQLNGEPPRAEQDVYSFAAMVYECLKGGPPFVRGAIEDQIKNKVPESLVGVSVPLARSVMAGLAKKPKNRPATCAAVIAGNVSRRAAYPQAKGTPADTACAARFARGMRPQSGCHSRGVSIRRNVSGITLPIICIVVALSVLGGVVWYRGAQRQEAARKRAAAMQHEENRKLQEELCRQAEEGKRREEEAKRKKDREAQLALENEETLRAKEAVSEIRVESRLQKGRVDRVSGEDGFKRKIGDVSDMFVRAEALYGESRWHDAAVAYTNYVRQCNELVELDGERQSATQRRKKAQDAFRNAEAEGAKTYARDDWNAAVKIWQKAKGEFDRMEFVAAKESFDDAQVRFADSGRNASMEKQRREQREAENKRIAEQKRLEAERLATIRRAEEEQRREEERRKSLQLPGKWICSTTLKNKTNVTDANVIKQTYEVIVSEDGTFTEKINRDFFGSSGVATFSGQWEFSGNMLTLRYSQDYIVKSCVGNKENVNRFGMPEFQRLRKCFVVWQRDGAFELRYDVNNLMQQLRDQGMSDVDCHYDSSGTLVQRWTFSTLFNRSGESFCSETAKVFRRVNN